MLIFFRSDASIEIGSGHIMRCLSLADELAAQGHKCTFICRSFNGNAKEIIQSKGHRLVFLDVMETSEREDEADLPVHKDWLGASWQEDAEESLSVMQEHDADWLIVDHYAIDYRWEQYLNRSGLKILVIDDLADRKHDCDVLLDQTYGRVKSDYLSLVPDRCKLLVGSDYSLLRPEFRQWRSFSLKKRNEPRFNIFINMGGVDGHNQTGRVLAALNKSKDFHDYSLTIVMGESSPHYESVKQQANNMLQSTKVLCGARNMAELMSAADFAIGAAGSTTWERCCLGVPFIQLVIADNQRTIAHKLASAQAAVTIDEVSCQLEGAMHQLVSKKEKLSLLAASICDGLGVDRVVAVINEEPLLSDGVMLKPAETKDCRFLYSLQTANNRMYFRNTQLPSLDDHTEWFNFTINDNKSIVYIVFDGDVSVGKVRGELVSERKIEISIIISDEFKGRGYAVRAIENFLELAKGYECIACIHKDNVASLKSFEKAGFIFLSSSDDFFEYHFQ